MILRDLILSQLKTKFCGCFHFLSITIYGSMGENFTFYVKLILVFLIVFKNYIKIDQNYIFNKIIVDQCYRGFTLNHIISCSIQLCVTCLSGANKFGGVKISEGKCEDLISWRCPKVCEARFKIRLISRDSVQLLPMQQDVLGLNEQNSHIRSACRSRSTLLALNFMPAHRVLTYTPVIYPYLV